MTKMENNTNSNNIMTGYLRLCDGLRGKNSLISDVVPHEGNNQENPSQPVTEANNPSLSKLEDVVIGVNNPSLIKKIENNPDFPDILDAELDFPTQFDIDNLPSKCYIANCYCKGFSWIKSRWQCEIGHRQPEITCDQKS